MRKVLGVSQKNWGLFTAVTQVRHVRLPMQAWKPLFAYLWNRPNSYSPRVLQGSNTVMNHLKTCRVKFSVLLKYPCLWVTWYAFIRNTEFLSNRSHPRFQLLQSECSFLSVVKMEVVISSRFHITSFYVYFCGISYFSSTLSVVKRKLWTEGNFYIVYFRQLKINSFLCWGHPGK